MLNAAVCIYFLNPSLGGLKNTEQQKRLRRQSTKGYFEINVRKIEERLFAFVGD